MGYQPGLYRALDFWAERAASRIFADVAFDLVPVGIGGDSSLQHRFQVNGLPTYILLVPRRGGPPGPSEQADSGKAMG